MKQTCTFPHCENTTKNQYCYRHKPETMEMKRQKQRNAIPPMKKTQDAQIQTHEQITQCDEIKKLKEQLQQKHQQWIYSQEDARKYKHKYHELRQKIYKY